MLSSIFSRGKGVGRISFPNLERKEGSACRLWGRRSSLLSRDVPYLERKEVSSCRLSGTRSSLLAQKREGPVCLFSDGVLLFLTTWGEALFLSRLIHEKSIALKIQESPANRDEAKQNVECNHDIPTFRFLDVLRMLLLWSLVYNENPWFQLAIISGLSRPQGGWGAKRRGGSIFDFSPL